MPMQDDQKLVFLCSDEHKADGATILGCTCRCGEDVCALLTQYDLVDIYDAYHHGKISFKQAVADLKRRGEEHLADFLLDAADRKVEAEYSRERADYIFAVLTAQTA